MSQDVKPAELLVEEMKSELESKDTAETETSQLGAVKHFSNTSNKVVKKKKGGMII